MTRRWQRSDREVERLKARNASLQAELESARRAARRQAAPFSKGPPRRAPRRPGRKSGVDYGAAHHRQIPEQVDEILDAPLPDRCPDCGGPLHEDGVLEQHQTEIPEPRPIRRRIDIHLGRCGDCGLRVRGRHPVQTSEASGAAGSQLGPRATAMIATLNKGLGLSFGKTMRVMREAFGVTVSRAGVWHGVWRAARAGEPTYQALIEQVRAAPVVSVDETGWKVEAILRWLWVFATPRIVVYRIGTSRGFEQAAAVLGADYQGVVVRDGWAPYLKFAAAAHQTCLAHLLRRCAEMIADADRGQARIPHTIMRLLKQALQIRDQRHAGALALPAAQARTAELAAHIDQQLDHHQVRHPPNVRLLKHLNQQRDHLLTFLTVDDVDATNWRAEQGVRPMVVTRKVWGGNREWTGAHAQEVLCTILGTSRLQDQDALTILNELLCSPTPVVAAIALELPLERAPPR
ncbi:MAG: IS66 family transposase [bacterium]